MEKNEQPKPSPLKIATKRFPLGAFYMTPGAIENVKPSEVQYLLQRHASCDWGDCGEEDWAFNCYALIEGTRIFSVYTTENGSKVWIITEADRSYTTMLLPSEY